MCVVDDDDDDESEDFHGSYSQLRSRHGPMAALVGGPIFRVPVRWLVPYIRVLKMPKNLRPPLSTLHLGGSSLQNILKVFTCGNGV